jgi:hypothetical protein
VGKFEVRQTEVAPGEWENEYLSILCVNGKSLFFKTIGVQETKNHSGFSRVPNDLTLAEAAGLLNKQIIANNQ